MATTSQGLEGFPSGSSGKEFCLPVKQTQDTWVRSLGWEDPLEKEMATHSSNLSWRIPRTEEPGGQQSMGSQRVRHDRATEHTHTAKGWLTSRGF